ncbi:MAG: substrate-binding periplasmic protein [Thiohalomonadales bacterium]
MLVFTIVYVNANADSNIVLNSATDAPLSKVTQDGFIDKVAAKAFSNIGFTLIVKKLPAERGLRNANKGLIDGDIARIAGLSQSYPNLVRVPEKIFEMSFVVWSYKEIDMTQAWDALSNRNVAYITGWKIFEHHLPKTALVTKTKNSMQLFTLLKKGRTDYVLYNRSGGEYISDQLNMATIKLQKPPLATKAMYIYLHKRHRKLVPLISQALVDMKKDGSYAALAIKYLPSPAK